jgi:hypothetical protein
LAIGIIWENPMKKIFCASIVLSGVGLILLSGGSSVLDSHPTLGIQSALANSQYGILGRQAPELELNTWIDGNGKPMDPVKLKGASYTTIFTFNRPRLLP